MRMEARCKEGRINNFEGLRGILAIWVVIGHILTIAGIQASSLGFFSPIMHGFVAVDVFIIMSGFFIFYLLHAKQETYKPFIIRRFLRLFPVYLICLFISAVLMGIAIADLKSLPWYHPDNQSRLNILESSEQYFIPHLIAHLTMLHGAIPKQLLPYSAFAFIGQAWSISLEWQFYLIAPFLMWICRKKSLFAGILVFLAGCLLYWQFRTGDYLGFLPNKLPLFILGIISFWSWRKPKMLPYLLIYACSLFVLTEAPINKLPILIWLSVFFLTYWDMGILDKAFFLYLGKISYSVYLSHMIILYLVLSILTNIFGLPHPLLVGMILVSVLSITILVSHFLYHGIEKPFINYGKKRNSLQNSAAIAN